MSANVAKTDTHGTPEGADVDRVTDLLPKAGEDRPMWIMRVLLAVKAWLAKPRSKVGWALALACMLGASGCSTSSPSMMAGAAGATAGVVAWHNYCVARELESEQRQVDAGLTPMVKSNGQVIRDNAWGYPIFGLVGWGAGYGLAEWARDGGKKQGDVTNIENYNYPPAEPAEPEEPADGVTE